MKNVDAAETGKVITQLRKKAGYTQKSLSKALGVTDKAVSKWERGLACPDIALLPKLSILLDTDIESILLGSPVQHEKNKRGIIVLEDKGDSSLDTVVYDKPLVYYLLSYFMLVGIREILIITDPRCCVAMNNLIGNGTCFGLTMKYSPYLNDARLSDILKSNREFIFGSDILFLFGKTLLYGLNMTRQLQTFMMQDAVVTRLATYGGGEVPLMFCHKELWDLMIKENLKDMNDFIDVLKKKSHITQRRLGRGMVCLSAYSFDEVARAADFVRLIQNNQAEFLAGLEEIAWRRGLISKEKFYKLACGIKNSAYREYLLSLAE